MAETGTAYQEVTFWDALDYIGALAYFPLTKTENPSEAEIAAAWKKKCAELSAYSKAHGDKKFLFVEIGYNVSARAAAEPWAFKMGGEHADEDPATLHRRSARSPGALPGDRGHVLVEVVSGIAQPRRGKLQTANPSDQSVDRQTLEEAPAASGAQ